MKGFSILAATGWGEDIQILVLKYPKICPVTRHKKSQDSIKTASDGILILDADVGEGWNQLRNMSSDRV